MLKREHASCTVAVSLVFGLFCAFCGCNSASVGQGKEDARDPAARSANPARGSDDPGINLECLADRLQNAPGPFHWSFKKTVPPLTDADWEADITHDSIQGTLVDSSSARAIHGLRSDRTGWNTAVMILAAPLPASTFTLFNNSSATVRAGAENVNGQNAFKYAVDTTKDDPADASLITSIMGPGGFIKGNIWVTKDGCPVKFILDAEDHLRDGTIQKERYEESTTSK